MVSIIFILLNILLGGAMGSFLNVVALRTASDESWWGKERSRCPHCGHLLGYKDLIPFVSYLVQRGRCRYCQTHISPRYLIVEAAGGVIGGIMAWRWGVHPSLLLSLATGYLLLLNALTDLNTGYIYDLFTVVLGVSGLVFRIFGGLSPVVDGLLGAALGFSVIAMIIIVSRGGMGWGDANLMAGLGLALGWQFTAVALYLGFMIGGVIALTLLMLKIVKRKDAIPLGPFLAAGGILAMVLGPAILGFLGFHPAWPWLH